MFLNSRRFAYDARGSLEPYCEMKSGGEESELKYEAQLRGIEASELVTFRPQHA